MKILQKVRKKVQTATYGSQIYKMVLDNGPMPEGLRLIVTDPWPGDAKAGQALISEQHGLFDENTDVNSVMPCASLTRCPYRDLRAVGSEAARRKAKEFIEADINRLEGWEENLWAPEVLGERISTWIGFYNFYASVAPSDFQERLIACLMRQLRHLIRIQPTQLTAVAGLRVIKGLVYGGLGLLDGDRALSIALDLLKRQIATEILPDGGHISRNPSNQLHVLRYLIDIRSALRAGDFEIPFELSNVIDRMVPALKLYKHGDGMLALFNGSVEEDSLWIDATITLAEARGRALRRLAQTGYERITASRSLLLVDTGAPPSPPFDIDAHAAPLAFEFSVGRERIIVNCGSAPGKGLEWKQALASTAAHSTLVVNDTNACEIRDDGSIGRRPSEVIEQRYEQEGVQYLEMTHNGYLDNMLVVHQRLLSLSEDGEELRGKETVIGKAGYEIAVRWHLHPAVQALLSQGGSTALLRTDAGAGWRLRVSTGDLALESSVYCGSDQQRRSMQLKLSCQTNSDPFVIDWSLTREKK